MKLSACILLLVSVFCLPARGQRPPDHQNTNNNPYPPGPYASRGTPDLNAFRFQQFVDSFFLTRVTPSNERSSPVMGTVSARQLLIPGKAMKEFKRGNKDFLAKDFETSAEHFKRAVAMYPDFAEALNNLGASYLMTGKYEKSVAQLEKAIALDPKPILPYDNLSLALFLLKHYPHSETAARRALQIDPRHATSLSLLGHSLAAQKLFTQEAVDSLRQSRKEIPEDRLTLAEILLRRGERTQAVAELREYLKVASGPEKQKVQCWLARLTQTNISHACGAS